MGKPVYKIAYDDLGNFTPQEIRLIQQNAAIFNNPDEGLCPQCQREKAVKNSWCLYCLEDHLKAGKQVSFKHLPERWPADAHLVQMAHELIEEHDLMAHGADIAYLMKLKHADKNGKVILGSCAKQSAKSRMLHGWDYIIEIAWDMWALLNDQQRQALLLHELCHVFKEDAADWKLEGHNVEEFTKVIEVFGLWKPDLQAFAEAIKAAEIVDDDQKPLPFTVTVSAGE